MLEDLNGDDLTKATLLADAASVGASVTEIQWTTSAADADAACAAAFDDVDSAVTASEFLCEAEASRRRRGLLQTTFSVKILLSAAATVQSKIDEAWTLLVGSVPVGVDPISALALIPGINTGAVTLFESAASAAVSTAREASALAGESASLAAAATVSEAAATTLEADAVALEAEVAALETSLDEATAAAAGGEASTDVALIVGIVFGVVGAVALAGVGVRNRASVAAALRRVTRRSNRGDARTGAGSNRDRGFDDIGGGGSDDARARRDRRDAGGGDASAARRRRGDPGDPPGSAADRFDPPPVSIDRAPWDCPACTFRNEAASDACGACDGPRPERAPPDAEREVSRARGPPTPPPPPPPSSSSYGPASYSRHERQWSSGGSADAAPAAPGGEDAGWAAFPSPDAGGIGGGDHSGAFGSAVPASRAAGGAGGSFETPERFDAFQEEEDDDDPFGEASDDEEDVDAGLNNAGSNAVAPGPGDDSDDPFGEASDEDSPAEEDSPAAAFAARVAPESESFPVAGGFGGEDEDDSDDPFGEGEDSDDPFGGAGGEGEDSDDPFGEAGEGGAFDAPAPAFGEQRRFDQPQSAFDQPQSAFDQPQSAFDQPQSAFDEPPSAFAAAAPPGGGFGDDSDDSDDSDPFGDATP